MTSLFIKLSLIFCIFLFSCNFQSTKQEYIYPKLDDVLISYSVMFLPDSSNDVTLFRTYMKDPIKVLMGDTMMVTVFYDLEGKPIWLTDGKFYIKEVIHRNYRKKEY